MIIFKAKTNKKLHKPYLTNLTLKFEIFGLNSIKQRQKNTTFENKAKVFDIIITMRKVKL